MHLFSLEHSKLAYRADFALYGFALVALATFLVLAVPRQQAWGIVAFAMLGLASWTVIEYAMHRFVLHHLQPFSTWHAEHHRRPTALICTPTILSAALIAVLVFLPALMLGNLWRASALTFGLLVGYLAYAITHHAIHHWHADYAWLKRRKRWHALHHGSIEPASRYGVTSAFWDQVFGSAQRLQAPWRRTHQPPR